MGARLSAGMAMLLLVAAARANELPSGQPVPLAVHAGRCEITLPAGPSDDKYLLVVAALTPRIGPHVVELGAEPSRDAGGLVRETEVASAAWLEQARQARRALEAARAAAPASDEFPALPSPPRQRVFYLFVKDKEFADPAAYASVSGELAGLGRRCQVYVDRDSDRPALQPTVDDIVRTFDEEVFPNARKSLGRALDVDRDGRFTVLLTPRLGRLVNGGVSVSGFVRGSDFDRDTPAPFGNRCDMMYLNADLVPGPHLRTVLAHEYTHAVIFSEHVFGPRPPGTEERDEEGWLNEALAHVVEKNRGYGWTNLDYRVSAFLSAPHRYGLAIPDYYTAGLWRSHGHRGAAFLFLEDCIARADPALVSRAVQSPLHGVRNLEVATERPFAQSFRDWSTAIAVAGLTADAHARTLFGTLGERWLCGPHVAPISLKDERRRISLAGTSAAYLLLHSPHAGGTKVHLETSPDVHLQVTLIRLPRHRARLAMRAQEEAGKIRLTLEAHDADIRLTGAAWERLVPTRNERDDTNAHNEREAIECCRAWFGTDILHAGEPRVSSPIKRPVAPGEAWVFKVCANDKLGPVTAFTVVQRGSEPK